MAQVLVPLQRLDRRPDRRELAIDKEIPAFGDFEWPTIEEEPPIVSDASPLFADDYALAPAAGFGEAEAAEDAPAPPEPEPMATPQLAFITVTDAAGRVLFRRRATPQEIADALASAGEATREGEAALERILEDRMFEELAGDVS